MTDHPLVDATRWGLVTTRRVLVAGGLAVALLGGVTVGWTARPGGGTPGPFVLGVVGAVVAGLGLVAAALGLALPRVVGLVDGDVLQVPGPYRVLRVPRSDVESARVVRRSGQRGTVVVVLRGGAVHQLDAFRPDAFVAALSGDA